VCCCGLLPLLQPALLMLPLLPPLLLLACWRR
jgi:hypothetical protein